MTVKKTATISRSKETVKNEKREKFGNCETFVYTDKFSKEHRMLCLNPEATNPFAQFSISIGKAKKILAVVGDIEKFVKKFDAHKKKEAA